MGKVPARHLAQQAIGIARARRLVEHGQPPELLAVDRDELRPAPGLVDQPVEARPTLVVKRCELERAEEDVDAVRDDAEILVFLDGDGSDPAEFIPDLVSPIAAGQAVFVLGSRVRGSCEPGSLAPQQVIAAHVGRLLLRLVYGASFTDLSPFRAIQRDELRRLGMKEETYGWNLEMLMRVAAARVPALEIAVGQRRRVGGVSKVSGNLSAGAKAAWSISTAFARLALELRRQETRRQ